MAEWTFTKANDELEKIVADISEDMSADQANAIIIRLQVLRGDLVEEKFNDLCEKIEDIENKIGDGLISDGLREIKATTAALSGLVSEIKEVTDKANKNAEDLKLTAIKKVGEIASDLIDSYNEIKELISQENYSEATEKIEAAVNKLSKLNDSDEAKAALDL